MMCAALYRPARIVAADIDRSRLEFARKQGLADEFVDPSEVSLTEALREWTQGRGADVVIEAAGGKDSFRLAWQAARPNAVVVIAAMYEERRSFPCLRCTEKSDLQDRRRRCMQLQGDPGTDSPGKAER